MAFATLHRNPPYPHFACVRIGHIRDRRDISIFSIKRFSTVIAGDYIRKIDFSGLVNSNNTFFRCSWATWMTMGSFVII